MTATRFIPCPLCGSDYFREIYRRQNLRIVKCRACGFMYQNPRHQRLIDSANAEAYYHKQYLTAAIPHRGLFAEKFDEFLSPRQPGKVLDIGCATGQFLEVARRRGWQAVGIDVSKWACDYLGERGFTDIHNCTLERADFPANHFDAVHMTHVLEHIPETIKFLGEVRRILKPNGVAMIEVPNEALFPLNYRLINFLLPKHSPPRMTPLSHLSLFTKGTLRKILETSRLDPIVIRTEGFATDSRTQTPAFEKKSPLVRVALLLCRLRIDIFLGLGRYIVAAALKPASVKAG